MEDLPSLEELKRTSVEHISFFKDLSNKLNSLRLTSAQDSTAKINKEEIKK